MLLMNLQYNDNEQVSNRTLSLDFAFQIKNRTPNLKVLAYQLQLLYQLG